MFIIGIHWKPCSILTVRKSQTKGLLISEKHMKERRALRHDTAIFCFPNEMKKYEKKRKEKKYKMIVRKRENKYED
jgi:hypothetical protein